MKRRKKHVISLITTFIITLAMIFSTFTMPSNVVMAEDSSVVDPTTQASWENYAHDTTEYIGRIFGIGLSYIDWLMLGTGIMSD